MPNFIEVHKYLVNEPFAKAQINFDQMIEWVTTNVGQALCIIPKDIAITRGQFGCIGDGWSLQIHNMDHPDIYSKYLWYMEIENDAFAVAFKMLWP